MIASRYLFNIFVILSAMPYHSFQHSIHSFEHSIHSFQHSIHSNILSFQHSFNNPFINPSIAGWRCKCRAISVTWHSRRRPTTRSDRRTRSCRICAVRCRTTWHIARLPLVWAIVRDCFERLDTCHLSTWVGVACLLIAYCKLQCFG